MSERRDRIGTGIVGSAERWDTTVLSRSADYWDITGCLRTINCREPREVVPCVRVCRIQLERAAEETRRRVEVALHGPDAAEQLLRVGIVGSQDHRALPVHFGAPEVAFREERTREREPCCAVPGFCVNRLSEPIDRFKAPAQCHQR